MSELVDVLIVGAGPAGSAAALTARRRELSVRLFEVQPFPRRRQCNGWLGPAAVALAREWGVDPDEAGPAPFNGVTLHSWDFGKSVKVEDRELEGWIVDRARFDHALLRKAVAAGADCRFGVSPNELRTEEERAVLALSDGTQHSGRVLVIADGAASPMARLAGLSSAGLTAMLPECLFAEFKDDSGATALEVAIGASRAGQIATITRRAGRGLLSIMTRERGSTGEAQFHALCEAARTAGVLPAAEPIEPQARPSTAGVALDMESHVGKRALLIGDAGGFVASFSNEGVYPAMKSGALAAETIARALKERVVQDELSTFGDDWRRELADYLRMPNTDLALLVPLVFSNEQMSRRVARAFLLGQQF